MTDAICRFAAVMVAVLFAAVARGAVPAYVNPVLDMDMSDPDCATADGTNFYLTVSSFTDVPGLPIFTSTDLVHWRLAGHALSARPKECVWTRRGQGVWAPAIRFHGGLWHVFWGDPDVGIFETTSSDPIGKWSEPELVRSGKGLIDPCPLWDERGALHIVNAFAASRAGFNSVIAIDGRIVYDGVPDGNHTIEGPKLYRHGEYYWIFAPAGGVVNGWQLALRSRNLYGPYEARIVMSQGKSAINGPHQGAWVTQSDGTDWFLHFQDKGYLGRVLCLQPMRWSSDGWPAMGDNGTPVSAYGKDAERQCVLPSVDWVAEGAVYRFLDGTRVYSDGSRMTKFPAPSFTARARVRVSAKSDGAVNGLLLGGDRDVRFGLALDREGRRFSVVMRDGESSACIGSVPAQRVEAGATPVWTTDRPIELEASVRPAPDDPRLCEVTFSCAGMKSAPARMANSIWQGVKIGLAAEKTEGERNWIDVLGFSFEPVCK